MNSFKQAWHFGKIVLVFAVATFSLAVSQVRASGDSQDSSARLKAVFSELLAEQSLYEHPGNRFSYEYVIHVSVIPDGERELEFCMIFAKEIAGKITMIAVVPQGKSFREQLLCSSLPDSSSLGKTLKYSRIIYTSDDFPILKKYALTFESISLRSIPPCVLTLHATEYDFSINSMFQRIVIHLETVNNFDDPCSYNALLQWLKEIRGFCPKKNRYENRGHPPIKNDVTDRSNSGDIMPKE